MHRVTGALVYAVGEGAATDVKIAVLGIHKFYDLCYPNSNLALQTW